MRGEGQERPQPLGGEKGIEEPAQRLPQMSCFQAYTCSRQFFYQIVLLSALAGSQPTTRPKTKMTRARHK
jgi:hypothetical protein